ncbi:MAG: PKD domain-containing protein, partial [Bacteroidota bacterium]
NAGPDQTICEGVTATLTATGGNTYYWQFNGSTASTVYVNPTVNTSYIVTVTSAAGCVNKDTVNVNLVSKPVVTLANAFFCTGFSTVLDAGNPGMTYDWSPTGEATQSIVVSTPGVYQVVVTNAAGCQGTAAATVIESGSNLSSNAVNAIACQGTNVTLDAGNTGVSYLWSNGATTQTINVNTTGAYSVTITDASGCTGSFVNNVTIQPKPTANFVTSSACLGQATTLADGSIISSGNIMSWSWTLPNGIMANTQYLNYNFLSAGTYPVKLVVTSGAGCVDSTIRNVIIYPVPTAQFSENTVCEGNPTIFANQSTISTGSISTYYWNFGDGTTGTGNTPSHTYASAGIYTTTLIVQSALGCKDTLIQSINVNPNPIASFSANDVCEGDTTEFINSSYVPNGILSDINWDFGDGASSTDVNPKHKYMQPGTYHVVLTVGSDQACQKLFMKDVTVNARPSAAILTGNVCDGTAATFANNSTISSGIISGYYWNFGDGTGSNNQNENHQYLLPGSYMVTLLATSDKGCVGVATSSTNVFDMPQANFANTSSCEGSATNFTDLSSVVSGSISDWSWTLGDGNTISGNTPSHTYASPGNYNVSLIVTTAAGCKDTLEKTISVYPVPVANFASGNVCLGDTTNYFDQSQVLGGSPFTYSWTFGDGGSSSYGTPNHYYNAAGSYPVQLTVTTPYGCTNTIMQMVDVFDHPITQFVSGNVCMNSPTLFMDASTVSDGTIAGWAWTLGDGTSATAQNPSHFYNAPGVYSISLETTSNHGCKSSIIDSIEVYGLPTPSPISGSGCVNNSISLMDTASGPNNTITAWEWDFGNGTSSTDANVSISFATAGTHAVSLTTTNANGCRATNIVNVIVNPLPVAGFIPSDACANSSTIFTNTSTISSGTISGYFWNFGDGFGTSTSVNPTYTYLQPGTYTVTMIATSNEGCSDTITHSVTIFPLPVPNFLHISAAGCGPLVVNFTDSSYITQGSVIAWFWDFGDGQSSTLQNPSHTYETSGTYNVTLTVTSNNGCENSITVPNIVTVYPGPVAEFEPDPAQASIIHPEFNFTNLTNGGLTYQWTFGDGTGNSQFEPNHVYADTGTYMVTLYVVNAYGCRDTVQHPVRVLPEFEWWIPNAFSPNEDGVNDGFNVKGISIVDVKLSIFNRWGDQIFYSEGRNNRDWDGSVVGENTKAQDGVYVYQVKVQDVWGKYHEKVGQVYLVR